MTISINSLDEFETEMADMASVGNRVRSARTAVGYSIEQLAVTCGLAHSEIIAMEEGLDADLGRIRRIAAALQVTASDLLGGHN